VLHSLLQRFVFADILEKSSRHTWETIRPSFRAFLEFRRRRRRRVHCGWSIFPHIFPPTHPLLSGFLRIYLIVAVIFIGFSLLSS